MASAGACGHKILAPIKPYDDAKKNFGPQSTAALKWAGGAKNPQAKNSKGESGKTDWSKIWKLECWKYIWQRNGGVRRTEKAKGGLYVVCRKRDGEVKELALMASREEGTNNGGVEMMIKLEAWVYW